MSRAAYPLFFRITRQLQVYLEYPSITRGRKFLDCAREGGEVMFWAGRLHGIVQFQSKKDTRTHENHQPAARSRRPD